MQHSLPEGPGVTVGPNTGPQETINNKQIYYVKDHQENKQVQVTESCRLGWRVYEGCVDKEAFSKKLEFEM